MKVLCFCKKFSHSEGPYQIENSFANQWTCLYIIAICIKKELMDTLHGIRKTKWRFLKMDQVKLVEGSF